MHVRNISVEVRSPLGWEGAGVGSLGREVPFGYASLDTCVFLLILNHII